MNKSEARKLANNIRAKLNRHKLEIGSFSSIPYVSEHPEFNIFIVQGDVVMGAKERCRVFIAERGVYPSWSLVGKVARFIVQVHYN